MENIAQNVLFGANMCQQNNLLYVIFVTISPLISYVIHHLDFRMEDSIAYFVEKNS